MADKNLCSVCSKSASFFCLCTSLQTLLCPLCVATHISSRGAHLISPLSAHQFVKKAEDLDRYNLRLQVVGDLTGTLEGLEAKLEAERKAAAGQIAKLVEEKIGTIRRVGQLVERDVERMYEAIKGSMQAIRKELNEAVSVSVVQLSEEAQLFVKSASHVREKLGRFIDIQGELSRRVTLLVQEASVEPALAFAQMLEDKSCGSSNCFSCEEIRKALEIIKPQAALLTPTAPQEEEHGFLTRLFGTKVRASAEEVMRKKNEGGPTPPGSERSRDSSFQ